MPMLRPWVPSRDPMLLFCLQISVCNAKAVETVEPKKMPLILIHSPNSMMTKAGRPGVVICTLSGVDVTLDEQLL